MRCCDAARQTNTSPGPESARCPVHAAGLTAFRIEHLARRRCAPRIVHPVPPSAREVADQLYARWNDEGLSVLTDSVDPAIELVCDPLCPDDSTLRGIEGWKQWVARWDEGYESMRITVDALIPMSPEHVLALVTITARSRGAAEELNWAAAHLWTAREGRIARYETHVDIALARGTLL